MQKLAVCGAGRSSFGEVQTRTNVLMAFAAAAGRPDSPPERYHPPSLGTAPSPHPASASP
eukprot:2190327-Amphidinium_carterae.1